MSVGSPVLIEHLEEGQWAPYMKAHLLEANPYRSRELYDDAGELDQQTVKFSLRYRKKLAAIEFDMPNYRVVWRGHAFDIRGYDDYLYRHVKVELKGVAHG